MAVELTRRGFAASAAGFGLLRGQPGARKPNLLLLMADQFRADCLGVDGNRVIRTPHLDELARGGVRFDRAYSSTPTCTPARAALLTGMSPWGHGMLGYSRVGEKYPVEMPGLLAAAGYRTAVIGKCHYHPQRNLHGFGFALLDESGRAETIDFRSDYRSWFYTEAPGLNPDATGIGWNDYRGKQYVLPERLHPTTWTADCAVRFLRDYQHPEPFFLKVSFARPHSPYDPPERFWKMYQDAALPEAVAARWADRYRPRSDASFNAWHGELGAAQVRESRQGYSGAVSFVDAQIGRILEALDQRGLAGETLVLFCSDHGDMTGDHHLWRKSYAYEASARIPMLLRAPGVPRGATLTQPVEIRDILPTLLDAAGAAVPPAVEGRSMLALAAGRAAGWREALDLEHDVCYSAANHWSALTDGTFKYIFHARDGEEQLFNTRRDPHELDDLAGAPEHGAELARWRARLAEFLAPRGPAWVSGGKLALRPRSILHSPNYPGCTCHPPKPAAG